MITQQQIEEVEAWYEKDYGNDQNFIYDERLNYKQTIQYQHIKSPIGVIVLCHISPSRIGDKASVFWSSSDGGASCKV